MKSKVQGVWLAAVLGACALNCTTRASASSWSDSIFFQSDYGPYILADFASFTINTSGQQLGNYTYEYYLTAVTPGFHDYHFSTAGSVYNTYDSSSPNEAFIRTDYFAYDVLFSNGVDSTGTAETFFSFATGTINSGQASSRFYNPEFFGPSLVPIPSSAPMFGVALIALGCIPHARRRMHGARAGSSKVA